MTPVKGYKIFDSEFKCRAGKDNAIQYRENETFEVSLPIKICSHGIHFCLKASDCFSYYSFDPKNIICEVEAVGEVQYEGGDSKACTNILKIGRRLTWAEVLVVANEGVDNTGHSNSGNWNSGDSNSGYRNSGNWNSGYGNSGDRNSGYSNSGNWNSGDRNSGNWNSGNGNSGDRNSGYRNSGNRNSGNGNSGNWNSGDRNSGNWNSGNWNSGDRNSGDSNSGYRNSGAFCAENNPKLWLFDKPTNLTVREWENHEAMHIMNNLLETSIWVYASDMTAEEKEQNPKYETTDGYLKTKTMHEAWSDMWGNLNDNKKAVFTSLPNFDKDIFKTITGIDI